VLEFMVMTSFSSISTKATPIPFTVLELPVVPSTAGKEKK
jgi:hypothetical protein